VNLKSFIRRLRRPTLAGVTPALRAAFTENIGFKLLSVIFAFGMWVWVQGEQVVEQKAQVIVDWVLPDELAVLGELPRSLALTVSGTQVFVRHVRRAELRMTVDLTDASLGAQHVQFQDRTIQNLPQNVRVVGLSPTLVDFELDEKIRKRVKVSPITISAPASGYQLVEIALQPDTVELEGPLSLVAGITEVPTSVVDIGGLREDLRQEVLLGRIPQGVVRVEDEPIVLSVDVDPVSATRSFEQVPVTFRSSGWLCDTQSLHVVLAGPVADIESIDDDDLMAMITVEDDVPREPQQARFSNGPVRYRLFFPHSDSVVVRKVRPETIEIRPAQE